MSYTAEAIKTLLLSNNRAVERALVALYHRQTSSEQASEQTIDHNGRGFTAGDAEYMTAWAKQVLAGRQLGMGQVKYLRTGRRIMKYAGQLADIANSKQAA